MDMFKNVVGSKKTTIAGAVLIVATLGAIYLKLVGWAAASPMLAGGVYLFIAKDPNKK